MGQEEDQQEKRGFKVEDRRRFSESGEARPEPRSTPEEPVAASGEKPPTAEPREQAAHSPPFEINFSTFVISLSTQALAHLGEIPHPVDNQTAVDLGSAKQLID